MTVLELINALIVECGDHNPADVKVQVVKRHSDDGWPDYDTPVVGSFGGNDHPFEITVE
jgi:hypothetical protein